MPEIRMLRRSFLKSVGIAAGGLALGLFDLDRAFASPGGDAPALDPNVWVHVAADGQVTIVCHRSEMGQGVRSSLPVLIADEMGADMRHVTIRQADGDPIYGDQNTDGSSSVRKIYEKMRGVGAMARVMLVTAAAKHWQIPPERCTARDHFVVDTRTGHRLPFGALVAEAAKLPIPKREDVPLRPRSELKHAGHSLPLIDGPALVAGQAAFGADVRLPGMLIAVIARPPVVGGKPAHYDPAPALAIEGVRKVIALPAPIPPYGFQALGGVAVVADNTWAAMRGRAALAIRWENGANESYDSDRYREELLRSVRGPGKVVRQVGDADAALAKAPRRLEAEYLVPHLAHTSMEPPACVAVFKDGNCEVWAATQNPQAARKEAARALGIDMSHVTIHVTFLGGGFGRKSKADFVSEAVLLARECGCPVRVQWTREDDVQHDYYHTTSAQRLEAGLDDKGAVVAWRHRTAFPSISSIYQNGVVHASDGELQQGVTDVPLRIANLRAENGEAPAYVRIGWLRSVCNIHHAFAVGSFLDELAWARKQDPRESLLELFGPARHATLAELGVEKLPNYDASLEQHPIDVGRYRHVIERVTDLAGWSHRRSRGRALGLAVHRSFLSYVAVVVAVVPAPLGKIRVDEAWVVADGGTVINPERTRAQMEGAVIFGMSLAMYGQITMRAGAVEQTNFRDYRLVRMAEAPRRIAVEIVASEGPPGGIGEPGVPPVAPALANAIFAATGKRVRELPFAKAGLV